MAEATCRRELELEIPAEEVTKQTEKVAKDLARVARIPGFRPGKPPSPSSRGVSPKTSRAKSCKP